MSLPLLERTAELEQVSQAPRLTRSSAPYSRAWAAILVASDLLVFCGALWIAGFFGHGHYHFSAKYAPRLIIYNVIYVLLWLIIFERLGLYRKTAALTVKDELYFTVAALTIGIIPQLILFTIVPTISSSRVVLFYAFTLSVVGVGITRSALHVIRKHGVLRRNRRVAIIGSEQRIEQVRASMELPRECTLLVPVDDIDHEYDADPHGGPGLTNIPWLYRAFSWGCDTIVFADIPPPAVIPYLLEAAALQQVRIAFAPPRIRRQSYALSLEVDGQQALIVPERLKACTPRARLAKRIMDVSCAAIAIALFSPIMALCAACIVLEGGRPIFYRQQRVGQNGREFEMLKFRSMRLDAEAQTGAVWAKKDDDRCTRTGAVMRRFSLDELPQLFNVLRGDMSLVGPRPERPVFVESFRSELPRYDERHLVRPGITGLSQMQMRRVLSTSDVAQKLTFDLFYIEEWSLFMDISLLIRTAAEVLFQRAA
jgi:exopolysaccharide biosynthesis polyprenyl glycosylphosphotransferase